MRVAKGRKKLRENVEIMCTYYACRVGSVTLGNTREGNVDISHLVFIDPI
jgi:hypothetical protein